MLLLLTENSLRVEEGAISFVTHGSRGILSGGHVGLTRDGHYDHCDQTNSSQMGYMDLF